MDEISNLKSVRSVRERWFGGEREMGLWVLREKGREERGILGRGLPWEKVKNTEREKAAKMQKDPLGFWSVAN